MININVVTKLHTVQAGPEAMPALGPPIEIKLLTCGTILVPKNNNHKMEKNVEINNENNKVIYC